MFTTAVTQPHSEHQWWLTEDDSVVLSVHFEQPGLGGLRPVVDELLQALPGDLQRVLVGEAADGLDDYGGFGVGASHREGFLSDQLEHPVFSDDFLWRKQHLLLDSFIYQWRPPISIELFYQHLSSSGNPEELKPHLDV